MGLYSKKKSNSSLIIRIKYIFSAASIIDLLAILPYYLPFISSDLRFLKIARVFRLIQLLKIGRYSTSLRNLIKVLKAKKEDLLISFLALIIILVFASSLIYFAENKAQPEVFSSIPHAMWWGVITLTTVGYGDIYPVTTMGKLLGATISILGIGLFSLPAGILASGFAEELTNRQQAKQRVLVKKCPHCGKAIKH